MASILQTESLRWYPVASLRPGDVIFLDDTYVCQWDRKDPYAFIPNEIELQFLLERGQLRDILWEGEAVTVIELQDMFKSLNDHANPLVMTLKGGIILLFCTAHVYILPVQEMNE